MQTFEDRLLAELKDVVAERAAHAPVPRSRARRRLRFAVAGAAAVAVAAGAAIGVPILLGGQNSAVARASDGTLKVYIYEFKDPEILERKLAAYAVQADITYLPTGFNCREPRGNYTRNDRPVWGPGGHDFLKGTYWRLRPDAIKPGETLVDKFWYDKEGDASLASAHHEVAKGPVKPCVRVPDPGAGEMQRGPGGGVGG